MKPTGHRFVSHRPLALPEFPWEKLKIGAGTPPVLCRHGWLILYHGVQEAPSSTPDHRKYLYSAGLMILDRERPHHVLYRSPEPVLIPSRPEELLGTVDGVVFPTGIDRRDDIGQPETFTTSITGWPGRPHRRCHVHRARHAAGGHRRSGQSGDFIQGYERAGPGEPAGAPGRLEGGKHHGTCKEIFAGLARSCRARRRRAGRSGRPGDAAARAWRAQKSRRQCHRPH